MIQQNTMREISLVNKLKFDFQGSIAKRALVIGDADNDQRNELVCANLHGDLAIFKDRSPEKYAYTSDLGMVTACLIGDVTNSGRNHVAAINTEGWLFIFEVLGADSPTEFSSPTAIDLNPPKGFERDSPRKPSGPVELNLFHNQRVPANCKELLLADLDGDGQNEIIIGLTDRVLRTYRWIKIGQNRGKFVGLYKWEFADQIGSVSLNPSRHENCQDIIVAQPGGTYAKLECFDKKSTLNSTLSNSSGSLGSNKIRSNEEKQANSGGLFETSSNDNVKTEYISKLTPEYHQLALSQMRNHHVSTEVLGGIRVSKRSDSYSLVVVATLDGTLTLVDKDEIRWSLQVDHQLFALSLLEVRPNKQPFLSQSESTCTIVPNISILNSSKGSMKQTPISKVKFDQYFVACAWNGKTYIVDEDRNYLRFKFDEAVSAFTAGNYHFGGRNYPVLVYATFNNQIVVYYDVIVNHIRPIYLLNEIMNNQENERLLDRLEIEAKNLGLFDKVDERPINKDTRLRILREFLRDILYSVTDKELLASFTDVGRD